MIVFREEIQEAQWQASQANQVPCRNCGRTFNPDRVKIHENVCRPKTGGLSTTRVGEGPFSSRETQKVNINKWKIIVGFTLMFVCEKHTSCFTCKLDKFVLKWWFLNSLVGHSYIYIYTALLIVIAQLFCAWVVFAQAWKSFKDLLEISWNSF